MTAQTLALFSLQQLLHPHDRRQEPAIDAWIGPHSEHNPAFIHSFGKEFEENAQIALKLTVGAHCYTPTAETSSGPVLPAGQLVICDAMPQTRLVESDKTKKL